MSSGLSISKAWARRVDLAVLLGLPLAGLLAPERRGLWYLAFLVGFAGLAGAVVGGAALVTWRAEKETQRLQGVRRGSARIPEGAWESTLAMWVAAGLLAWPLWRAWTGRPIGLEWSLSAAGGLPLVLLQNVFGVLALDAWLYWKHRLLHTRLLFAFHRGHHQHRDPTALASFAVGPVEALLTFWPLLLVAHPKATHYGPLYLALVVGFVGLNFYLHCGLRVGLLERVLAPFRLNTSVFHNRHHANAEVNFGEAFTLWDRWRRTREEDRG